MNKLIIGFIICIALSITTNSQAQSKFRIKKWQSTSTIDDQFIFSWRPSNTGVVRFSYIANGGTHLYYNYTKNFGIMLGYTVRNVGHIDHNTVLDINNTQRTLVTKRRVYTAGIPLGIRLGNIQKRNYASLGGGLDIAVHAKTKAYYKDDKRATKIKASEYFSDQTNLFLPYGFVAYRYEYLGIKYQMYFNPIFKAHLGNTQFISLSFYPKQAAQSVARKKINLKDNTNTL
jgi:hypothetical protein